MARLAEAGNPADVVFYSASGGNAGLACVHAATFLGRPATVVVPLSTSRMMMDKLLAAGAREVIQFGASLQEAGAYLRDVVLVHARERGEESVYVPPYDHPDIWAGHATVIDEVREQMREMGEGVPDVVVCSVGGGGLLNGIMLGMAQYGEEFDRTQILAVETMGADSLFQSLRKSEMVTLPAITSMATSLGAVRVSERTFELASRGLVDGKVVSAVLTDAEAAMGCWRFADDERILVEPACGVNLALCYGGRLEKALGRPVGRDEMIVIEVCGGQNVTTSMLEGWKDQFGGEVEGLSPLSISRDSTGPA